MVDDFISVPFYIERDGKKTHFLPALGGKGGYRIGEKGSEKLVADYWDAIAAVNAMSTPRFRRRNSEGNAGIVACKPGDVEEVSRTAIQRQIDSKNDGSTSEEARDAK